MDWWMSELMVLAALRYCLTRKSLFIGVCAEWLPQIWSTLGTNIRQQVLAEIRSYLNRSRADPTNHKTWSDLLQKLSVTEGGK